MADKPTGTLNKTFGAYLPPPERLGGGERQVCEPLVNAHLKTYKFKHRAFLMSSTRYGRRESGNRGAIACNLSEAPTICFCGARAKIGHIEKKDR
jgi:hypothetical protein